MDSSGERQSQGGPAPILAGHTAWRDQPHPALRSLLGQAQWTLSQEIVVEHSGTYAFETFLQVRIARSESHDWVCQVFGVSG